MAAAALQSYLAGHWRRGTGSEIALHDASTGSVVATVAGSGLDTAAALHYARSVGGPALRALTFTERAPVRVTSLPAAPVTKV